MKLGINSYTFMWAIGFQGPNPAFHDKVARPAHPLTAIGLLDKAEELGVRVVQTGPNLGFDLLSDTEKDHFIVTARERGIELELGTRGLDYGPLREQVHLAKRMGAKLIRTLPEVDGKYVVDAQQILPPAKKLLPILAGEGIQLAVENGRTPAADLRAALDELNSPYFGVVLDMVNSLAVPEGWKEVTRLLAPYTMCVHYKDFTIRRAWHMMSFICEGTPSGQGMVDTAWLFEQLKVSQYDFNVFIELWPPEQNQLEDTIALEQAWAVESVRYLRQYIKD